jgi:two-component system response regulator HydG
VGGAVSPGEVDAAGVSHLPYAQAKKATLTAFERHYLTAKLKASNNNISKAAREAGMDRSNFKRLLRESGIASGEASTEGDPE